MYKSDTIAAIATPVGLGSIAVVKVSGPEAVRIVNTIYLGGASLLAAETHTLQYGHIIHPESKSEIDEVMVAVMHAPKTATREDMVEIHTHGGIVIVQAVLEAVISAGARLADPGEFTKRAFLNGRIDLSQAEAIADLIEAKTAKAAQIALQQVKGSVYQMISTLRDDLLDALAHLAVEIDYPEYDAEKMTAERLLESIRTILGRVEQIIQTSQGGRIYREGLRLALIGRPNVGKSSLMNFWLRENRAIVTDIPGTTRDTLQESVNIAGVPVLLIDTAGIRETEDIIEKIGVERSFEVIEQADLLLYLLDNSAELDSELEQHLSSLIALHKNMIIVVNKSDLSTKLDLTKVNQIVAERSIIHISVIETKGLDLLEEEIIRLAFSGRIDEDDHQLVTNVRQINILHQVKEKLNDAKIGLDSGLPIDMTELDLRETWSLLGEITGETATDDLLDQIFSKFCLGK